MKSTMKAKAGVKEVVIDITVAAPSVEVAATVLEWMGLLPHTYQFQTPNWGHFDSRPEGGDNPREWANLVEALAGLGCISSKNADTPTQWLRIELDDVESDLKRLLVRRVGLDHEVRIEFVRSSDLNVCDLLKVAEAVESLLGAMADSVIAALPEIDFLIES